MSDRDAILLHDLCVWSHWMQCIAGESQTASMLNRGCFATQGRSMGLRGLCALFPLSMLLLAMRNHPPGKGTLQCPRYCLRV